MAATLWKLHLSRHVDGMVAGPVKSIRPAIAGRYSAAESDIVAPCPDSIRECLPHYYRKAWDRAGGSMWHPSSNVGTEHAGASYIALRDSRGRYLNTVYAFPDIHGAA